MSYAKGKYPVEGASKIGHMKLVTNPEIQRVLGQFESSGTPAHKTLGALSGSVDVTMPSGIEVVVTIDGGQAVVPNPIQREKCVAYLQVCAVALLMSDLRFMRDNPMMDPRNLAKTLERAVWYNPAILPLSGVNLHGQSVKETIRRIVDGTLHSLGLYATLRFLVSREWDPTFCMPGPESPRFDCRSCGAEISVPRSTINFVCPICQHPHTLSDYLGIGEGSADDWSREEAATALRDVLETLTLFHFVREWRGHPDKLGRILFIKDGPLLLRAALSRLVEPIRAFLEHLSTTGVPVHIVGVEKSGDVVNHLQEIQTHLPNPGDFFLPDVKYVVEEISGQTFAANYRNRVHYGAKVVGRVGPHHLLAMNVPTGPFLLTPQREDLLGFDTIMRTLPELVSYQFENALLPVVVANSAASIAQRPSGDILNMFTDKFLGRP